MSHHTQVSDRQARGLQTGQGTGRRDQADGGQQPPGKAQSPQEDTSLEAGAKPLKVCVVGSGNREQCEEHEEVCIHGHDVGIRRNGQWEEADRHH